MRCGLDVDADPLAALAVAEAADAAAAAAAGLETPVETGAMSSEDAADAAWAEVDSALKHRVQYGRPPLRRPLPNSALPHVVQVMTPSPSVTSFAAGRSVPLPPAPDPPPLELLVGAGAGAGAGAVVSAPFGDWRMGGVL